VSTDYRAARLRRALVAALAADVSRTQGRAVPTSGVVGAPSAAPIES
jgi:hypothetical protein